MHIICENSRTCWFFKSCKAATGNIAISFSGWVNNLENFVFNTELLVGISSSLHLIPGRFLLPNTLHIQHFLFSPFTLALSISYLGYSIAFFPDLDTYSFVHVH